MKEFADDNFKFDENGRKLSKWVENTVGKGEIAHYEQFLLFPRCFQKACFPEASKGVIVWEWVKLLTLYTAFSRNDNFLTRHPLYCKTWLYLLNLQLIPVFSTTEIKKQLSQICSEQISCSSTVFSKDVNCKQNLRLVWERFKR